MRSTSSTARACAISPSATGSYRKYDARLADASVAGGARARVVGGAGAVARGVRLPVRVSARDGGRGRLPRLAALLRLQRAIVLRRHGARPAGRPGPALPDVRRELQPGLRGLVRPGQPGALAPQRGSRRLDGVLVWPYTFDWREGRCELKAAWICAMAQGLGISVLVRAHRLGGGEHLLELCHAATRVFEKNVEDGGVRTLQHGHALYEEYPGYPLPRVLDGFLFSLLGLWDLAAQTGERWVYQLFADGIAGLVGSLDFWDYHRRWSWYGSHGYLCPPHYNKLNAALLRALSGVSGEPILRERAEQWDSARRGMLTRAEVYLAFLVTKNLSRVRHRTWRAMTPARVRERSS